MRKLTESVPDNPHYYMIHRADLERIRDAARILYHEKYLSADQMRNLAQKLHSVFDGAIES